MKREAATGPTAMRYWMDAASITSNSSPEPRMLILDGVYTLAASGISSIAPTRQLVKISRNY